MLGAVSALFGMLPCALASILLGVFALKSADRDKVFKSDMSRIGEFVGIVGVVLGLAAVIGLAVGLGVGLSSHVRV